MIPQVISAKGQRLSAMCARIDNFGRKKPGRLHRRFKIGLALTSLSLFAFWLHWAMVAGASAASNLSQSQGTKLVIPGEVIDSQLTSDAVHRYHFTLPSGQYLRLSVAQKDVAIVTTLLTSEGVKLVEADYIGKENVSVIAPLADGKPTTYQVEIRARSRNVKIAQVGHYVLRIEEQRPATARDEDRVKAERMVAQATQLSCQSDQGRDGLQRVVDQYRASLQFWRTPPIQHDDRLEEARTLYLMALRQQDLGENQAALESNLLALEISRAEFDQEREGVVLSSLGTLYSTLGDKRKAIDCYNSALRLSPAFHDAALKTGILVNLGIAYKALGQNSKAMECYQLALTESQALGDQDLEASVLTNLARLFDLTGDKTNAAHHYQQVLGLWRSTKNAVGEAVTLKNLGALNESAGRKNEALELYQKALELARSTGDVVREAHIRGDLARVERDLGNFNASRAEIELALTFFETQRQQLLSPELRASFAATNQQYYEFYIDLLVQQQSLQTAGKLQRNAHAGQEFLAEAFFVSESARTRALADLIAESRIDLRAGISRDLLNRERELGQELNVRKSERVALQRKRASVSEIDAVEQSIVRLSSAYDQAQNEIRRANPRFAALMRPAPLKLIEVQRQLLDRDTVMLEYSLGEKRSYVWAIGQDKFEMAILPPRDEIEGQALKFYELLTARSQIVKFETPQQKQQRIAQSERDLSQIAASLSCTLLQPVSEMLRQKRLLVVGDGILNYIPFAALPEPVTGDRLLVAGPSKAPNRSSITDHRLPLLVNHEVINLPSATVLAELRRDTQSRHLPTKDLAIVADPVFSRLDERLHLSQDDSLNDSPIGAANSAANQPMATAFDSSMRSTTERDAGGLTRLHYSRREAFKIASMAPENKRLLALDFEANRSLATEGLLSPYRYVHFATHGLLNGQSPELSGLVLSLVNDKGESQLGVLRLDDIYKLNLSAELVVLSACRTGLGKEIRGEGVIGLARGFMHAGVPRVISSLWSVDDAATAELMARVYRELISGKSSPTAALRSAQLSLWKTKKWQSPYYWAAFTLQGEPK
ncbi:MAG TPA: CHAT domain-containing tetratricopeptide repeat protein [Blastocatellia bacterium]|nr:CHAT domain-containing tetratricopeptide repeat protein [Blastocatellia bacterium]